LPRQTERIRQAEFQTLISRHGSGVKNVILVPGCAQLRMTSPPAASILA
jgi:hypothetical protein